MTERTGVVTFKGKGVTLIGDGLAVGKPAPDFTATASDLSGKRLSEYRGKVVILSVVPSLDTAVCDVMTRRFNVEAGKLGAGAVVLTLSMDLPMAQKRWCGSAGVANIITLSDYKDHSAGVALGLRIKELGLLARAVIVIDKQGIVRYAETVKEIAQEPNYDAALEAAKKLL